VYADRGDLTRADPDAGVVGAVLRARAGLDPFLGERGDDRRFDRAEVRADVGDAHDRIADELAGAVVGDAPAAVGRDDVDAFCAVEVLAERQLARARASPVGVDGGMLEQEERVGQLLGLPALTNLLLEADRVEVGNRAEVAHP
jgi:hypothetical protein